MYQKLCKLNPDKPVDLYIETAGGSALWYYFMFYKSSYDRCIKICHLIRNRNGQVRGFVRNIAHSAGTLIALSCDELWLNSEATLSPIDVQVFPFKDLLQTGLHHLENIIISPKSALSDLSKQRSEWFKDKIKKLINEEIHNVDKIISELYDSSCLHEKLYFPEDLKDLQIVYNLWDEKIKT